MTIASSTQSTQSTRSLADIALPKAEAKAEAKAPATSDVLLSLAASLAANLKIEISQLVGSIRARGLSVSDTRASAGKAGILIGDVYATTEVERELPGMYKRFLLAQTRSKACAALLKSLADYEFVAVPAVPAVPAPAPAEPV
jgi:hypothetical protein